MCAVGPIEKRIILVNFNSINIGQAVQNKEQKDQLLAKLGYWRKCLGTSGNLSVNSEQLKFEKDFLKDYFPEVTLADMDWMIQLYIQRLLPMEYPIYVNFHPNFMASVIHAYRLYKAEKSRRLENAVQRQMKDRKSTPAESMNAIKWMMEELLNDLQNEASRPRFVKDVYKYLRRSGQMDTGIEQAEEAKRFALDRLGRLSKAGSSSAKGQPLPIKELLQPAKIDDNQDMEFFVQLFAIIEFFKKNNAAAVAATIEERHFINP